MKSLFSFLLIILLTTSILAQAPSQKWKTILELEDQIVFLDTSSIKKIESQITALSLSKFKTPVLVSSINKNVSSVKSQLLFDLTTKKYTVVGTLFYDENWRIMGESSLPGFSTNTSTFAIPIDSNKIMIAIYSACNSYLGVTDSSAATIKTTDKHLPILNIVTDEKKDTTKETDKRELLTEKFIDKKLKEETPPEVKQQITETKKNVDQPIVKSGEEKKIHGTIFTSGSKYYFQVSSWKNKYKAEEEVTRLKKLGHNAFITEAYLANKGGMWYRVRIGYFDSLGETEQYMNRMK